MSGQDLANLAIVLVGLTILLSVAAVIFDKKHRKRLEGELDAANQAACTREETLNGVRQVVEEGVEAIELDGPVTEWGRGYLACADAVLRELDR